MKTTHKSLKTLWLKPIFIALIVLLGSLQYELWFSKSSLISIMHLRQETKKQRQLNSNIAKRNQILVADIKDLKQGSEAFESRARNGMGFIKKGEIFYQIIDV